MSHLSIKGIGLIFVLAVLQLKYTYGAFGFGGNEKVLLKDLSVITLHHGQMTNSRRTSPIPQMKCIGGTAGSDQFVPQVVQCYNRGFDGYDVQWECKTDMDNAYRFGKVEVSCEGFDYPDDPYILRGSCGLEYTLDLTKEGNQQKSGGQHNYYQGNQNEYNHSHKKGYSLMGDLVVLAIIGVVIYAIYKTCFANQAHGHATGPDDNTRRPGGHRSGPPPAGFRDEYMPGGGSGGGGCSSNYDDTTYTRTNTSQSAGAAGSGAGGFWGGAATGGLLGYLFGSRTNQQYYQPGYATHHRPYGSGWGSGWGSSGSSWGSGRSSGGLGGFGGGSSSGTRTASGFGGTRRR